MKIAIACADIQPDSSQGGIAVYTHHVAAGLAGRGHQVTILGKGDSLTEAALKSGVRVVYLPNEPFPHPHPKLKLLTDKLARSRSLARFLRSHAEFDVVEFPVWDAEGWHATKLKQFKSVVRGHTPHAVVNDLARAAGQRVAKLDRVAESLERAASRRADLFLANSESSRQIAIERFGIPASKVAKCLHGIPSQAQPIDVSGKDPRIIFVGRLETRKGVRELFQAIPKVLANHPKVKFEIAGSDSDAKPGTTFEQLFRRTYQSADFSQVTFHGRLSADEIDDLRRRCQIAVLPSRYESFGLVHAEAMSFGVPVVAFDISATREVVEDGVTGLLVKDGDADALASAMDQLIRDEDQRVKMGKAAFDAVASRFSVDSMAACVEGAYSRLLKNSV